MKKGLMIIVSMLLAISMMASACTAVKTKKADEDKKETTEEAEVSEDTKKSETEEATTKAPETTAAATDSVPADTTPEATSADTTSADPVPQEDCELIIDITYDENIVLAKYTVVLYLDGEKIDSMENGKYFVTQVSTTTGEHELKFEKRGDSTFETTVKVTLSGDSTLIFEIKSHLDEIEIKSSRVADGLREIEVEMPDVTEMRLPQAIEALEAAGFKNISTESATPIIIKGNWVVIAQNFPAGQNARRDAEIILSCEKDG